VISEGTLETAVRQALITPAQADALRALERGAAVAEPGACGPDDEALRFITGFADIFVTLGVLLFTGALADLTGRGAAPLLPCAAVAVAAWLQAELFSRRRRMALPSIVLLLLFAGGCFGALMSGIGGLTTWHVSPTDAGWPLLLAGLITAVLVGVHYRRFAVPITVAAGMATLLLAVLGLLWILVPGLSMGGAYAVAFLGGIATFVLAMRFDLTDPRRLTRRSDVAFWLHMLAAPLMVHGLVHGLLPEGWSRLTPAGAVAVLALFVVLGAVAIVIDRRAILVSGLAYVGFAFGSVIRSFGLSDGNLLLPLVVLAIGALILLLSAGWAPLRRTLLRLVPAGLASRLPYPAAALP
jgi:hypothetical protein